jgi:hypothetical protein
MIQFKGYRQLQNRNRIESAKNMGTGQFDFDPDSDPDQAEFQRTDTVGIFKDRPVFFEKQG